jgi:hypothetical protein
MAQYIKIKKAKNLRFRLISVLYLLFISLSILQIPLEWLRINENYADYFQRTKVELTIPELEETYQLVGEMDSLYTLEVGFNAKTGKINEPTGYTITDQFFIKKKNGERLHSQLRKMKDFFDSRPEADAKRLEFYRLFDEDLKNGLENANATQWVDWTFKHTPAIVAKALMAEYRLRVNLLSGAIDVAGSARRRQIVQMAYNIETLRPGDTVRIVVAASNGTTVTATEEGKSFELNKWKGDTLLFVPPHVGMYELTFKKNASVESLKVRVIPKQFEERSTGGFQTFYVGKPAELQYVNLLNAGMVYCSADRSATLDRAKAKVTFTPDSSGWCEFSLRTTEGKLLLEDSIYVQAVPRPFILVDGNSSNSISIKRLKEKGMVQLSAMHPEMPGFEYRIKDLDVRLVGCENPKRSISGSTISLTQADLDHIQYIIVDRVAVSTQVRDNIFKEPQVIQINR